MIHVIFFLFSFFFLTRSPLPPAGGVVGYVPAEDETRITDGPVLEDPLESSTPAPTELWSCTFSNGYCGLTSTGNGDWYLFTYTNTTQHNDGIFSCFCCCFLSVRGMLVL